MVHGKLVRTTVQISSHCVCMCVDDILGGNQEVSDQLILHLISINPSLSLCLVLHRTPCHAWLCSACLVLFRRVGALFNISLALSVVSISAQLLADLYITTCVCMPLASSSASHHASAFDVTVHVCMVTPPHRH